MPHTNKGDHKGTQSGKKTWKNSSTRKTSANNRHNRQKYTNEQKPSPRARAPTYRVDMMDLESSNSIYGMQHKKGTWSVLLRHEEEKTQHARKLKHRADGHPDKAKQFRWGDDRWEINNTLPQWHIVHIQSHWTMQVHAPQGTDGRYQQAHRQGRADHQTLRHQSRKRANKNTRHPIHHTTPGTANMPATTDNREEWIWGRLRQTEDSRFYRERKTNQQQTQDRKERKRARASYGPINMDDHDDNPSPTTGTMASIKNPITQHWWIRSQAPKQSRAKRPTGRQGGGAPGQAHGLRQTKTHPGGAGIQ